MNKAAITLTVVLGTLSANAAAYEVDTHAFITSHAFERSLLDDNALIARLGIDRFGSSEENPPLRVVAAISYTGARDAYYDIQPAGWMSSLSYENTRLDTAYDWAKMYSMPGEFYRSDGRDRLLLKGWLMRGAIREDDLPLDYLTKGPYPDPDPHGEIVRVYHHFYDPVHHDALATESLCADYLPDNIGRCHYSPDWAFGRYDVTDKTGQPVDPNRRNHFTWADAREAMWCALTRNTPAQDPSANVDRNAAERRLCWATTIDSLGHVLHLLEDTAQPQHVRNDPHNPPGDGWISQFFGTSVERRAYEAWTNFRVLGGDEISGNEEEDAEFLTFFGTAQDKPKPVETGKSYPIPRFSEPQYYFTTRQVEAAITPASLKQRRGLADLTNRSLFSEGTILDNDFPLPPPDATSPDYVTKDRFITHFQQYGDVIERHLAVALTDPLKGAYADASLTAFDGRIPLATVSLWKDFGSAGGGVISLDEYSAHADVLIPRAIAYSAGLIDYFFRGKLEITAPLDGLFSVIDHATPHTVNAKGYPIRSDDAKVFGFTRLRMRVRNATDVVNESGTNLPIPRDVLSTSASAVALVGDPTLVAVARYHRNPCYKPDLSGERRIAFDGKITEAAGCGAGGTRTGFQELSVSKPVGSNAASLNGAGQDLVFDFGSQPIPVNATDLAIQVVYRGPLGLEDDAIAVGTFDVREPTYLTHWNNTDYAACSGAWAAHGNTPPGCITQGVGAIRPVLTTRVCIGSQLVFEHLEYPHGSLGSGNYVRLVALLDDTPKATRTRSIVFGLANAEMRNRTLTGHRRQSDKEQAVPAAPYVSDPFFSKRGFVGSTRPLPYYQINGADPQPADDAGALDVGALAGALPLFPAPDPGDIVFPDVAQSSMACTTASAKAMFGDEMAQAAVGASSRR